MSSPKRSRESKKSKHSHKKRSRKSKKSKHSHKKRRYQSPSSSSDSIKDYGQYQRSKHSSSQASNVQTTVQPDRVSEELQNLLFDNSVHQISKDSGSDSEQESWSFDKAISEVFRLVLEEMCPRPSEDHTPSKSLSRIELLMESHTTPLPDLPHSKLIENTTKYIQSKLDMDELGQDWTCPQQFVKSLAPLRYNKTKSQYFPTQSIPPLNADASQIFLFCSN